MPTRGGLVGTRGTLGLVLVAALVALVVVASGSTSGSGSFQDGLGDHPSGRPDIDHLTVTNDDYGGLTFEVLVGGERLLSPGDFFFIFLDTDLDQNTGSYVYAPGGTPAIGADRRLRAIGTTGFANVSDCTWDGSAWAGCKAPENTSDTIAGENAHTVKFTIRVDAKESYAFRFLVGGTHIENDVITVDSAPDAGEPWRYDANVNPDYDADGLRGDDDVCPRVSGRGKLDRNHNGCPGPFQRIRGVLKTVGVAGGGATTFRRFSVHGLPAGAHVTLSSGGKREQLTASAGGIAASKLFRRRFADGTKITVRATKARFVGYFARYRIHTGAKLVGRALCIPAYGLQEPTACTAELLGQ